MPLNFPGFIGVIFVVGRRRPAFSNGLNVGVDALGPSRDLLLLDGGSLKLTIGGCLVVDPLIPGRPSLAADPGLSKPMASRRLSDARRDSSDLRAAGVEVFGEGPISSINIKFTMSSWSSIVDPTSGTSVAKSCLWGALARLYSSAG